VVLPLCGLAHVSGSSTVGIDSANGIAVPWVYTLVDSAHTNKVFHHVMAITLVLLFLADLVWLKFTQTTLSATQLWMDLKSGALAWEVALILILCGRLLGAPKLWDAGLILIWTRLFTVALTLLILAAGRSMNPLQDHALAVMDERFGLTVPAIVNRVAHYSWLKSVLDRSYDSLSVLAVIALILPLILGKMRVAKEMLVAGVLSLILTAGIFAVIPAVGPWTSYALQPAPDQTACTLAIAALRHVGSLVLDTKFSSIVCFPSFHVVVAVISAVSIGRCWRMLVVPVSVWGGLIVASVVATGWHYVTDVWGGLALSVICLVAAGSIVHSIASLEERVALDNKEARADELVLA
jgi:hypothetical protein